MSVDRTKEQPPGRPALPPETARPRELDHDLHVAKAKEAGLTEAQARRHANAEQRERDMLEPAELQTPGKPLAPEVPDRTGKPGKDAKEPERIRRRGQP